MNATLPQNARVAYVSFHNNYNTMAVHLAFLGTGTCCATSRKPSATALSDGNEVLCVDFGGGAYHQIARLGRPLFNYRNISTVFLTHFHVDHISGLPDLLWGEMWDYTGRREDPITLVGPHGLKNFYEQRLLPFLGDYPMPFEVNIVELADGASYAGSFYTMVSYHLEHGEFSTGYLFVCGDARIAFTGDTAYCGNLVRLLGASSLAVMEWSIQDTSRHPGHLSADDVIRLLKEGALPKKMFANHLYLPADTTFEEQVARNRHVVAGFPVEFYFPVDGDVFENIIG